MDEATSALAELLHDYRDSWHIGHQDSPPAWVAVRRPTITQTHVLVALDIQGLRAKLAATGRPAP